MSSFHGDTFGDALKWALESANISQTKLANLLGVSRSQVSNMVNGHFTPSEKKIREIEQALGNMFKFSPGLLGYKAKQIEEHRYSRIESAVNSASKEYKARRAFSEGYSEMNHILNLMIYNLVKYPEPAISNETIMGLHTIRYLLRNMHKDYLDRGMLLSASEENEDS